MIPEDAFAQSSHQPDGVVDGAMRSAVIEKLLGELDTKYVFTEVAKKMRADIESRLAKKEYDGLNSSMAFADRLTKDLKAISKDKHLRVRYSHQPIPVRTSAGEPTEAEIERQLASVRRISLALNG